MANRLRYAMIGGGPKSFIGPIHRMAIRMDDLAELVDGCYSHTDDWHALLKRVEGKVDFIVVCTPNNSHYAIAKAALLMDFDVFLEKPMSLTVKEAEELARLAAKKRRVVAIPFTYTGYPMIKLARDLVKRGELGKIDKIDLEYVQGSFRRKDKKGRPWKMDPKLAGPSCVVADIGVHAFNMIEYVTGLEVQSLLADLSTYANDGGLDDDASILMRLNQGAKAALVTSKVATGEENGVRLRVYGSKASLYWDQEAPNYLTVRYPELTDRIFRRRGPYMESYSRAANRASRFPAGHHEGFVEALANIYDEFVLAVRTRKVGDFPTPREGVRSIKFVEAALKSNRNHNRWVRV